MRKIFSVFVLAIFVDRIKSQCQDVSNVKFKLIRGSRDSKLDILTVFWDSIGLLLKSSYYDNKKSTVVYAHGFTESYQSRSVQIMIEAFLTRRNEFNIFIIDWAKYANGNYILEAIPNSINVSLN
jgi:hypothetical protein